MAHFNSLFPYREVITSIQKVIKKKKRSTIISIIFIINLVNKAIKK